MIKEKTIKIKIHSPKYYNLVNIKSGDVIDLDIKNISKGSHIKITAICDICGNEKETAYKNYIKMTQKDSLYYCVKCRDIKTKNSNLEKYGVENVMQIEEVKEKMYETNLKKYGHMCSAQSDEIKEKSKQTCLKKYGVEYFFESDEMREKVKKTNLERYGVENVMQVSEIKKKNQETWYKNHGVGNDSEFIKYSKLVRKLTKRNIIELYDRWDGYDYYDDEYIKDNLKLYKHDPNYPNIDHKISIYYGYKNRIPAKELSYINNLCITKKKINSSKNRKSIEEFSKKVNYFNMKTKIICILDRSPSMSSIIDEAISGFNLFIDEQKKVENSDNDIMKIIQFDTECEKVFENVINSVEHFNKKTYKPQGCGTALYDAIGKVLDEELDMLGESPENRPDKTLCIILTDGYENSSSKYHQSMIKLMIEEMEREFKWNFIFLAANQDAIFTADKIGISRGKAMNFAATGDGINVAYQSISNATTHYRTTKNKNYDNIFDESQK